ncbi:HAD-IA family hydrolase [Pseudoxanthomonas daejeonensis]|uniref:Hydrolase n=1 Tax=Pseudoxanthomonas daejeonensis TaxID=266062 RepID=A0ABQ6Z8A8_9GAMM|nr:HAD-IA family hydrolase [Pseudoxanthomonas daejeonensis]KAF1695433.1 hydrolase [Pseudoxanthomonas daejeonensis]
MIAPRLELLLLDFDGVLARYERALRCAHLAQVAGCPATQVMQVLFSSGLELAYDSGALDTATYLRQLGEGVGTRIDETAWIDARVAACAPDPRILAMVAAVARRYPVAILTNNGPLMAQAIPRIVPELFPALDGRVLCSGTLGGRKPQATVYTQALERLGARAASTLFVDDLFVNVQGARRAGLHADTVRDARSMRRVLARFGLPTG